MESFLFLGALLTFLLMLRYWPVKYYAGPTSDHFDGKRFFNPNSPYPRTMLDALKWQLTSKRPVWPKTQPLLQLDTPPSEISNGSFRISMVGHSTVLIQTHGKNILTDPIWASRASPYSWMGPKRAVLPGIQFDKLPKIDVVVISHNHYDHMDKETIKMLTEKHNPLFITPLGNDVLLKKIAPNINVITLDWLQHIELPNTHIKIWCYQAHHWSRRWLNDQNKALWGAFVIETPTGNIYFAGDTGYGNGEHFKTAQEKFKEFKVALLPIGAFKPIWFMSYAHISPIEAIQAMYDLNAKHAVALHFQTFHIADDEYDEPVKMLKDALQKHPQLDFKVLNAGEAGVY